MARAPRTDVGDCIYHVLNRANMRARLFEIEKDYLLFERLLEEAVEMIGMRVLAYTVMPNHWHFVLHTERDKQLAEFIKWLAQTHSQNWHIAHKTSGSGHIYQDRFKSFPVQTDQYLLQVLRYVERNPVRAKLVQRAEDWQWGSLWRRIHGTEKQQRLLSPWPIGEPYEYLAWVNQPEDEGQLESIRRTISKNCPFGDETWEGRFGWSRE